MFKYAIILAVILGYIFKGNLRNLGSCNVSGIYLVFVGFSIEAILHYLVVYGLLQIGIITYFFNFLMYILLFTFIYLNRTNMFLLIMGFGFLLNAIVIFANGGVMPVGHSAIVAASLSENVISEGLYGIIGSGTKLWFLGDIIASRILGNLVFSLGDLIATIGLMIFIITEMRGGVKNTLKA